jgi:para-nitrobenzyl esterase
MSIGKNEQTEPGVGDSLGRREALRKGAAMLGGLAATAVLPAMGAENTPMGALAAVHSASLVAKDGAPVVDTVSGKVVGYVRNGISTFKGVPYAESTDGANRFMPPVKPKPWSGVRSSRQYGHVAPQAARTGWSNDEEAFMFSWDDGTQGEDCLRVNVWTPGINDQKKRPVMVWLHGGGFAAGSGQELKSYDGENLARRGDVVVVTLNHRLNVLGYLDLSQYGEGFARSANVGMLDIVAALEWVRDNIEAFGGDPRLVTIFGQSGGGGKVSLLMGMPAATGLFHRAIVESGSMLRAGSRDRSRQLADLVVAELGLNRSSILDIQILPYEKLSLASANVLRVHTPNRVGGIPNFRRMAEILGLAPVVDGIDIPAHPFDPKASALSAHVPMIIGSTLNEFVTALGHPEFEAMTSADLDGRVSAIYGDKATQVIEAFRKRTPNASAFDLWSHIAAAGVREATIAQATAKAALGKAPAYVYWFTWQTPILSGRPRAFHCAEIPFVFDNTDRCENMTGGGADARALAAMMSDAWIQFARTGNPNHARMPHWQAHSPGQNQTMIFDNRSYLANGPDTEEQKNIADA